MEVVIGDELDGRLFTDLSKLQQGSSLVATSRFYIRTRASHLLPRAADWKIRVRSAGRVSILALRDIARASRPLGTHLMECAGNTRAAHFGMLSVAEWAGVPVAEVLDRFQIAGSVLISGFDHYQTVSTSSVPGASWIFPERALRESGAFFATQMNGAPLTPDHGAPVRLVVPGWYGCSCIKWVNEIAAVGQTAVATSQMTEYAQRTQQHGTPLLSSQYAPAIINFAAMPVRVEKWSRGGRICYRIIGIAWGRPALPTRSLQIRINPDEKYRSVSEVRRAAGIDAYWSYWWTPYRTGPHEIRLRASDSVVQGRRLDSGYYARTIDIDEI